MVKTTGFLPEKTSAISTALRPPPNRNTRLLSFLFLGAKKPSKLYSEYYAVTDDSHKEVCQFFRALKESLLRLLIWLFLIS